MMNVPRHWVFVVQTPSDGARYRRNSVLRNSGNYSPRHYVVFVSPT